MHRNTTRSQSGTAMLETAIVLPLLLLLLFGIFEFGLAFARMQALTNAAREAAREASRFRPTCRAGEVTSGARQIAQSNADRLGMAGGLSVELQRVCQTGRVSVTVAYRQTLPVLSSVARYLGGNGLPSSITLTGKAEMLNESR
jgi:Flp pilus assembly protein TadG